ncbi:hypothetical protein STENM327S_04122 [Streptomyces tendae]
MGNGSLLHSGDNQTGHGDGDDETVTVEFARLPSAITSIVFVAAAYKKGSSFQKARNISFEVYDATGGSTEQVADIWPSLLSQDNGCAVAKAVRAGGGWKLEVVNETGKIKQGDEHALMRFAVSKYGLTADARPRRRSRAPHTAGTGSSTRRRPTRPVAGPARRGPPRRTRPSRRPRNGAA